MNNQLKTGITKLGFIIHEDTQKILLEFIAFLQKWNQTYNLTAIKDMNNMITYHLLDSLSILAYLKGNTVLDLGSGAGFPGIPLALTCPEKVFTLLDSKAKKTIFLLQAAAHFKITNVTIIQERATFYKPDFCFDVITCRAFGSLNAIIRQTQHLLCPQGQWLVMKGTYPEKELQCVHRPFSVHILKVPRLKVERHLVKIKYS